jgi:TfoX/Sxy family transcriptional regulator of competence genes
MAYDEELADRVRRELHGVRGMTVRKMFGGIAFMVRGNMCCGVIEDKLMVRVGPEAYERTMKLEHTEPMDFTGKAMRGLVYVTPQGTRTARQLRSWIGRGLEFVKDLPTK